MSINTLHKGDDDDDNNNNNNNNAYTIIYDYEYVIDYKQLIFEREGNGFRVICRYLKNPGKNATNLFGQSSEGREPASIRVLT